MLRQNYVCAKDYLLMTSSKGEINPLMGGNAVKRKCSIKSVIENRTPSIPTAAQWQ